MTATNSSEFPPCTIEMNGLVMVIGVVPVLVSVMFLVVRLPRYTVPKAILDGATVSAEMKFAVTPSGPLMVTVVEALMGLATGPVQLEKTYPALGVALRATTAFAF